MSWQLRLHVFDHIVVQLWRQVFLGHGAAVAVRIVCSQKLYVIPCLFQSFRFETLVYLVLEVFSEVGEGDLEIATNLNLVGLLEQLLLYLLNLLFCFLLEVDCLPLSLLVRRLLFNLDGGFGSHLILLDSLLLPPT